MPWQTQLWHLAEAACLAASPRPRRVGSAHSADRPQQATARASDRHLRRRCCLRCRLPPRAPAPAVQHSRREVGRRPPRHPRPRQHRCRRVRPRPSWWACLLLCRARAGRHRQWRAHARLRALPVTPAAPAAARGRSRPGRGACCRAGSSPAQRCWRRRAGGPPDHETATLRHADECHKLYQPAGGASAQACEHSTAFQCRLSGRSEGSSC